MTTKEIGMWVAISSFGMLFGTFLLSYLLAMARFPSWPPPGMEPVPFVLPTISTAVLVLSSLCLERAMSFFSQFMAEKEKSSFRFFWRLSLLLGTVFLVLQCFLWSDLVKKGLNAKQHLYAASVYVLTGLHAIHVLGALLVLLGVYYKFAANSGSKTSRTSLNPVTNAASLSVSEAPKLAMWFWHFLGVVWLFTYLVLVII